MIDERIKIDWHRNMKSITTMHMGKNCHKYLVSPKYSKWNNNELLLMYSWRR